MLSILETCRLKRNIISGTESEFYPGQKPDELLGSVLQGLLREKINLKLLLDRCLAKAPSQKWSQYSIVVFGPSKFGVDLAAAVKENSKHDVILHAELMEEILVSGIRESMPLRGRLAIVGMAGRFPGAASHDKLWELLKKGLDVHREVRQWS